MRPLWVLSVVSEAYPLVKTGGLADVAGALPAALAPEGVKVVTLMPGYPAVMAALGNAVAHPPEPLFGGEARILAGSARGLDLLVLDAPHLFARAGNPYLGPDRRDWPDNARRFAGLALAAARIGLGALGGWRPHVVHAHDWQAALAPSYLRHAAGSGARPASVVTVHNLAFQGWFPASVAAEIGLPPEALEEAEGGHHGGLSFLKAGLQVADRITTVSPTYAREITTEADGMGLDPVLRARAGVLSGIVNGIDTREWDPARDGRIAVRYGPESIAARGGNKAALQARFGLEADPRAPLFGAVTRLTGQKGSDLMLEALPSLLEAGGQLAVLGSGEAALEAGLRAAQAAHPGRIACTIGYDETLAHQIQAGADMLLVPSRFEPCGLTQLCALRYGAVPLVARVGGLADTVTDATPEAIAAGRATGVVFAPVTAAALAEAIRRAAGLYRDPGVWAGIQAAGMRADVSWREPARAYARLYRAMAGG